MKSLKRLLAVVLSIAMVMGTMTVTALAADNVAEVTVGSTTTGYASIDDACAAAVGTAKSPVTEATIKLLKDISLTERMNLRIDKDDNTTRTITFDANGKNITTNVNNGFEIVNKNTTLNITGDGNWTSTNTETGRYYLYGNSDSQINVLSGTFSGALAVSSTKTPLAIKGGVWDVDPTSKLATGYEAVANTPSTGKWTVQEKQTVTDVAEVTIDGTTTKYDSIDSAITAFIAGTGSSQTLKLLDNATASTRIELIGGSTDAEKEYTIDLAGYNLTASSTSNNSILVRGYDTLNIVDTSETQGATFSFTGTNTAYFTCNKNVTAINIKLGTSKFVGTGIATWGSNTNEYPISIDSGIFSIDPTQYAIGTVTKTGESEWTVTEAPDVCEINGTKYKTITAAVEAATDGDTITMIADYAKADKITTIPAAKSITLDLNGKTLTNTYSGSTGTNARWFIVKGTLTITDTSAEKTGSMTVNNACTANAGISYADGGTVYVNAGNFFTGAAQTPSTNNCWMNTNGGTHQVSGGWFAESARPTNSAAYVVSGSSTIKVLDAEKSETPYTITSTKKTINYSKNAKDATGTVESATEYYLEGYTTSAVYAKTNQYSLAGYSFMGWSTNEKADPDKDTLIAAGEVLNLSQYSEDTIQFYAIWKKVDVSMWVCVKTDDPTVGYADLAAALSAEDDVTLIKNVTSRNTITGSGRLNLNGYNIVPTEQGSALVIKSAVSIYNEDAGTITVGGVDYKFGKEGIVRGTAQGTGGAIDAGEGATVKIYGGTFEGDAPTHGTVLTCSKTGQFLIYGGTFTPSNAESTVDAFYANNSKIYVLADTQSDVKMTGAFAKNTSGEIGIQGGYFSEAQPNAIVGTYDEMQGTFTADPDKSLLKITGDETYPYSVSATPWYITYNLDGGENDPANPAIVGKTDATAITLQPASKDGYTFTGWTDEDGNTVTSIKGSELTEDLTLNANYEVITYNISYNNLFNATTPTITTYTVEDDVTLEKITRPTYELSKWTVGTGSGGDTITGWKAGEMTGDIDLWANWSSAAASVQVGEGTVVGYKNLADAVAATLEAGEQAVTLKLLKDQTIDSRIELRTDSSDYTARNITIDLNNKTITKGSAISGFFIINKNTTATIKGGTLDSATYEGAYFYVNKDATLNVTDGTFAGGETIKTGNGNVVITGGTWNIDPTDFVDTTKYIVQTDTPSTGLYTVIIDPSLGDIFKVGETGYKTVAELNAAISSGAVAEGATIKCLGEIETTSPEAAIKVAKKIELTIDLDGNDVVASQTDKFLKISNGAEVNITGGGSIASSHTETSGGTLINVGESSILNVDAAATIADCGTAGTETLPIYSKGFVYIAESMVPTVDGKVYQAQTAVKVTGAYVELQVDLTMTLETMVAPAAADISGTLELASTTLPSGVSTTTATITGAGAHQLKVEHINASQMANKFTVTPTVGGTTVGNDFAYSIVDYTLDLYDRFGDEPVENAALLTLVANLLAYGKEAQAYWPAGGGVAFNVPTEYTSFVTTTAPTATDNVKKTTKSASDASNYKIQSATLNVNEKVSIVVTVFATGNFTATCDGVAVTQDDAILLGTNTYRVIFKALNPSQFNDTYTVSLANAGGTEVHAVQYSVNSYCYNMNGNAKVGALALAIYNYGVAAEAYILEN